MGFATLVRSMVGLADRMTADLQVAVTIVPVTKQGDGEETLGTAYVEDAVVERRQVLERSTQAGLMSIEGTRITFPRRVSIGMFDRLSDSEGDLGPVLFIGGPRDPQAGQFITTVWCGGRVGSSIGA